MRGYYERDDEAIRLSKLEDEMKKKARALNLKDISRIFGDYRRSRSGGEKLEEYRPAGLPIVIIHGESYDNGEINEIVGIAWLEYVLPSAARFFTLGSSKKIGPYELEFYSAQARAVQFYEHIGGEHDEPH